MDYFCFLTCPFFFHFIAYGLRPSGLGFDGFFLFFDLLLLFPFYCLWFKASVFRLWWTFFFFSIWCFFYHFIGYDLRPSGLGFKGFFLFFHLQLFFPFYCLWFKALELRLWWIFFAFQRASSFPFYCLWFKAVGFKLWWIFFVFQLAASLSIFLPMVKALWVYALMDFFLFFNLQLLFPLYCLWFKAVGFRLG